MHITGRFLTILLVLVQLSCSGSSGGGGSAGSGDAASFFTEVKGTYQWYAKNTDASTPAKYNDDTFKHGKLYTITIDDKAVDNPDNTDVSTTGIYGSVVIEGEGQRKAFNFGDGALFENAGHEQYVVLQTTTFRVTLQHVFENNEKFINYGPNDLVNKSIWILEAKEPDPLTEPKEGLAKYGAEFIIGTHTMEVYSSSSCKLYSDGDEVVVTIDEDGNIDAAKFGKYTSNQLSISSNISTIMWCEGGQDTDSSCNMREKPVMRITGEKATTVKGGGYQLLSNTSGNSETCHLRIKK